MEQPGISTTISASAPVSGKPALFLFGARELDFLLIGGLAVMLWLPFYFLQNQIISNAQAFTYTVSQIAFWLAFAVNYPHFMASYKLAYLQGPAFILNNWFQLILVPAALLLVIISSLLFFSSPVADSGVVVTLNSLFDGLGLRTRVGLNPNLGTELLGHLIIFMYFTVGWHYAKQTFGCMMVFAKLDNFPLTTLERNLIRYSLLSTWWLTWLYSNCSEGSYTFYNLTIHRLALPYLWYQIGYAVVAILVASVAVMLIRKYLRQNLSPSFTFLVPMVALLTWHVPLAEQPQYFYFIAFFHSLQYFPFVAKVENTRYRRDQQPVPNRRLTWFFTFMVIAGALSFYIVPTSLDSMIKADTSLGVSFFMITFLAFINIHHYFIDNVLWRFKNREVKELLLQ